MNQKTETDTLIQIVKDLVSLRSDVNHENNETLVSKYITNFFSDFHGWNVDLQSVTKMRKNIIVSNSDNPSVIFIGHQDTVPVTNAEQLKPKSVGKRLYGRGTVDMKCGLAMMLGIAKMVTTNNLKIKVAFVFTVDEEYTFLGIKQFIKNNNWQPKFVINPQSTNLQILNQCRGCMESTIEFQGKSAHAGRKSDGINAIEKAVEFCKTLEKTLQAFNVEGMQTSVNLASIEGGVIVDNKLISRPNVVPDYCKVTIEYRIANPKLTKKMIKKIVTDVAGITKIEIKKYTTESWYGSLKQSTDGLDVFNKEIKNAGLEIKYVDSNTAGYYEIQMLQNIWNCPIIAFGAGPNEKSHQSDEYVDLNMLQKSYDVLKNFVRNWNEK